MKLMHQTLPFAEKTRYADQEYLCTVSISMYQYPLQHQCRLVFAFFSAVGQSANKDSPMAVANVQRTVLGFLKILIQQPVVFQIKRAFDAFISSKRIYSYLNPYEINLFLSKFVLFFQKLIFQLLESESVLCMYLHIYNQRYVHRICTNSISPDTQTSIGNCLALYLGVNSKFCWGGCQLFQSREVWECK